MYKITIKTIYNTIVLEREDYNTPEMQEIYEQPYVQEVEIEKIEKGKVRKRCKKDGAINVEKQNH